MAPKAKPASAPKAKAKAAAASQAPAAWPPKVPMGPIEDVLPMIEANDEDIDMLMLRSLEAGMDAEGTFGPKEIEYVCECLQKNSMLTHLNASFNPVGDSGVEHIAKLLSNGGAKGLMRLELNCCGVGSAGAIALAEVLTDNKTMQVVELMNNSIDDEGGKALLEMLKKNRKLKQLQVSLNQISAELQAQIDKQLLIR
mmetsp:Transcript_65617/g.211724  ORF Transcript_65617/g.211724 Transcript_65617/m.211724 type:complete len:198 (-) Transcript_65617:123-716(-)